MYSIAITQSCIVFIFLTIFFYTYVSSIEKEEYQHQLERLVDDFFKSVDSISLQKDKENIVKMIIYGAIDTEEDQLDENTKETANLIDQMNSKVIDQSYSIVIIYIIMSLIFLFILYKFGDCFSLTDNLKEGLFILFFIFVVEFSFLNLIAKNYIASNLNTVKTMVAQVIINYVNNRM